MPALITDALVSEYEAIIFQLGENATNDKVIAALVKDADWTERGAQEVLHLAEQYGVSILRNALALASAMQIEDGDAGL